MFKIYYETAAIGAYATYEAMMAAYAAFIAAGLNEDKLAHS